MRFEFRWTERSTDLLNGSFWKILVCLNNYIEKCTGRLGTCVVCYKIGWQV